MRNPFRSTGEPSPAEKFDRFLKFEEQMRPIRDREQTMIRNHAHECYGTFGTCISCGCWKSLYRACVSHQNTIAYQTHVNKRLAEALEAAKP